MTDSCELVKTILERHDLQRPDGRPLYGYRPSRVEMAALNMVVRAGIEAERPSRCTAMAFTLWASKWWHDHHTGGPWKWADMLHAVGAGDIAPPGPGYGLLQDIVSSGLRAWGRQVLLIGTGRGYLVSLACEGGLPLKLVMREQGNLRRYFKALLEEFRLFSSSDLPPQDLAQRVGRYLPANLRQDVVFELSGWLVAAIWELQSIVPDVPDAVAALDERRPNWRDRLPLDVSDSVARTLLNNLLMDAADVARGGSLRVKYTRQLRRSSEHHDWELEGRFELPVTLRPADFNKLFGREQSAPLPGRLDLLVRQGPRNLELLSIAVERNGPDGNRVLMFENARSSQNSDCGASAAAGRALLARAANTVFESDLLPGGQELSELPWTFVPDAGGSSDSLEYSLAGQGSASLRDAEALVVVPEGSRVVGADESASVDIFGAMKSMGRKVYRVRGGAIVWLSDSARVIVTTGAVEDTARVQRQLVGRTLQFGRGNDLVFLGKPALHERRDGHTVRQVPEGELQWKPDVPGATWRSYSGQIRGAGRLRHTVGGNLLFSEGISVLPRAFNIRYEPSTDSATGRIILCGVDDDAMLHVSCPADVKVDQESTPGRREVRLTATAAPPTDVEIVLDWGIDGRLRITSPFPAIRVDFLQPDGSPIHRNARAAVDRLAGIQARAIAPTTSSSYFIEASYFGNDIIQQEINKTLVSREMIDLGGGHHVLDLLMMQGDILDRLSLGDDVDAAVRLRIPSDSGFPATLRVTRFDLRLHLADSVPPHFQLEPEDTFGASPEDIETIELEAVSILDPGRDVVLLARVNSSTWEFPVSVAEGPYLVVGRQGHWYRVRPMPWYHCAGGIAAGGSEHATTLQDLYAAGNPAPETALFANVLTAMAADTGHEDWPAFWGMVDWTDRLPGRCFPMICATADPDAAHTTALAAFLAGDAYMERYWREMESLPFWWPLVPMACWETALARLVADLRRDLAGQDAERVTLWISSEATHAVDRVTSRLPWLEAPLALVLSTTLGKPIGKASAVMNPQILSYFLADYRNGQLAGDRACPALSMSPSSVPWFDGWVALREGVGRLPGGRDLLVSRTGRFAEPARAVFADAPAIAAVTSLSAIRLGPAQIRALRTMHDRDPGWFTERYRLAFLYAFGSSKAHAIRDLLDA